MSEVARGGSELIETLFGSRRIDELSDFLHDNPELDIIELRDSQEMTVLHQLAFEGHLDILRLFVKEAKKRLEKGFRKQLFEKDLRSRITTWMNVQNKEGFTALHYAAYSGHIDIIKFLI